MNNEDEILLEENGWEIECTSPFEIRANNGSFASGEAAWIVLWSLRPSETDPKRLLQSLEPDDKRYMSKLHILVTLIDRPDVNFIIPTDMHEWCESVGFETKLSIEDGSSWWTCKEKHNDSI
jgi:hypothetical protein